jgi:hypothetical protein
MMRPREGAPNAVRDPAADQGGEGGPTCLAAEHKRGSRGVEKSAACLVALERPEF